MTIAETKEDAERQVLREAPQVRVLRSREIDMSGIPPLSSGPIRKHWVVVVEHPDPEVEAGLPQHDDPEEYCEREARLLYLKLGVDPDLLVSGVIEQFPCPACGEEIRLELPAPREGPERTGGACPHCRTPLTRPSGNGAWKVAAPKTDAPTACVFCGSKADSKEHVIPAWISKQLGIRDFLAADEAFVIGREKRRQPISFASHRARILCTGCNAHFKHLEDAVIPLLVPMARGRVLSMDFASQALLARWAHKTAIALVTEDPEMRASVPAQHARALRFDGRVGHDTTVAFFAWSGGPVFATAHADIVDRRHPTAAREGYLAILAFREVGFCVMGFAEPLPANEVIDWKIPAMRQFWPPVAPRVHWPPPRVDNSVLPVLLSSAPLRRTG